MKLNFKRLMAVLLSIMMIVGMMPMSVFATDIDLNDPDQSQWLEDLFGSGDTVNVTLGHTVSVSTIDGDDKTVVTTYATLAEAFAAAQDGDTVKLIADCTADPNGIGLTEGKGTIVLDLNGYTITSEYGNGLTNYSTMTITDSSDTKTGAIYGPVTNYGTMTINGGKIETAGDSIRTYAVANTGVAMTINGGTILQVQQAPPQLPAATSLAKYLAQASALPAVHSILTYVLISPKATSATKTARL